MYSFPQQQKIFKDLLNSNSSNKECADCNTIGPTWASLNFGVFLCSNCSGAHRALGPTITRVKSTKLDQWQKEWMDFMQVGNKQLNEYWQAELGMSKKPRMGASQPQLIKYAAQKYVKKRFVRNQSQQDPLTRYKNGTYTRNTQKQQTKSQQSKPVQKKAQIPTIKKPVDTYSNVAVSNESRNLNLIEFQFPQQSKLQVQSQTAQVNRSNGGFPPTVSHHLTTNQVGQQSQCHGPIGSNDDDEFSEFTEHGTSFTGTTTGINLTYEELLAKKNIENSHIRCNLPNTHHSQSMSSIPHHSPPHYSINMNGHAHHVGGPQASYGNTLNFKQLYTQNPYQSVGFIPAQNQVYPTQQYNSVYNNQNSQFMQQNSIGIGQNFSLQQNSIPHYQTNNLSLNTNLMSNPNQQDLNPHAQTLGGYHNQGYGSHSGQSGIGQPKNQQEFKWNDYSGWAGLGKHHQTHQQTQPQPKTQPETQSQQPNQPQAPEKSWLDDWK